MLKIQQLTNSQFPYLIKQFTCTQTACRVCFVFIDMGNGMEVRFDKTVATELIINWKTEMFVQLLTYPPIWKSKSLVSRQDTQCMFISYWGSTKCEKTVVEGLITKRQIEMAVTITITHILPNLKKHAHKQDSVFVNVLGGIGNWRQGYLRRQRQKCWTLIEIVTRL